MTVQVDYPIAAAAQRAARHTLGIVETFIDQYPRLAVGQLSALRDSLEATDDALRALLRGEKEAA